MQGETFFLELGMDIQYVLRIVAVSVHEFLYLSCVDAMSVTKNCLMLELLYFLHTNKRSLRLFWLCREINLHSRRTLRSVGQWSECFVCGCHCDSVCCWGLGQPNEKLRVWRCGGGACLNCKGCWRMVFTLFKIVCFILYVLFICLS